MKVVFRADASIEMGTGHVMRCLTLADALTEKGVECHFICREHLGHLAVMIKSKGYALRLLPMGTYDAYSDPIDALPQHAHWLGSDWRSDAVQTSEYLRNLQADWVVVDHYGLDLRWEKMLRGECCQLMVIDDLIDRRHDCDLLLDQTFGRDAAEYQRWVPSNCRLVCGSYYALLRPEFAAMRDYSLSRRQSPDLKRLLITMGGVDKDNVTGQILAALPQNVLPKNCQITVIMGASAPWLEAVELQVKSLPWQVEVKVNVSDMAQLMADSDLAIGAAGSTSWERCCLGVPTLMLVTADNQQAVARSLALSGAAIGLNRVNSLEIELKEALTKLSIGKDLLSAMSCVVRGVCDGLGAQRVAKFLLNKTRPVLLRAATEVDCDLVFQWQSHPDTRRYFNNPQVPSYREHCNWYSNCLERNDRRLFIVLLDGNPAGMLRLDDEGCNTYEVSIVTAKKYQGQGVAKSALSFARETWPNFILAAVVNKGNLASQGLFESLGYAFNGTRFISLP